MNFYDTTNFMASFSQVLRFITKIHTVTSKKTVVACTITWSSSCWVKPNTEESKTTSKSRAFSFSIIVAWSQYNCYITGVAQNTQHPDKLFPVSKRSLHFKIVNIIIQY